MPVNSLCLEGKMQKKKKKRVKRDMVPKDEMGGVGWRIIFFFISAFERKNKGKTG